MLMLKSNLRPHSNTKRKRVQSEKPVGKNKFKRKFSMSIELLRRLEKIGERILTESSTK
jgi:hypothetical protein